MRLVSSGLALLALAAGAIGVIAFNESREQDDTSDESALGSSGDPRVIVTRASAALPEGCTVEETVAHLRDYLSAFSRGDLAHVAASVAAEPEFLTYEVNDLGQRKRRTFVANRPADVVTYVRSRHRQGERLGLSSVRVSAPGPLSFRTNGPTGGFSFVLRRQADDLERLGIYSRTAEGKGGINCTSGRIYLWVSRTGPRSSSLTLCPRDQRKREPGVTVACTLP